MVKRGVRRRRCSPRQAGKLFFFVTFAKLLPSQFTTGLISPLLQLGLPFCSRSFGFAAVLCPSRPRVLLFGDRIHIPQHEVLAVRIRDHRYSDQRSRHAFMTMVKPTTASTRTEWESAREWSAGMTALGLQELENGESCD